ncbi:DNA primase [Halocola ammonii]
MIPKETIDKIYESIMIEDVVGDFVQLKKAGTNYKGLSPFTSEKTPSFFVSPAKGIYKCFSSGKGGNAVNFLMEHERFSYPEALRWLADKYGIEVQEEEQSAEEIAELNERESLAIVTTYAQEYFTKQLFESEEGRAVGLSYFKERGFREETCKEFLLGYCPDDWDAFTREALKNGYELKFLEKAGLTKTRNGSPYDFFRGRVMFPIRNISGKVIGFGGRTLKSDKKVAKYFNSPESELYNKSRVLYGLYLAKNEILKKDLCYLVEGYTDVISLHQNGVENVVSSSGTSLTEGQIRQIKRYTNNITILYDGDPAGIKASFRGIDMILSQGMNVKVVLFPEGEDPDSYAKSVSTTQLKNYIENESKDFIVFKTDLLAEDSKDDPIQRSTLIKEIVHSISLIPDAIQRTVYIQECSRLLDMEEETLLAETNRLIRTRQNKSTASSHRPQRQPESETTPVSVPKKDSKEAQSLEPQERDLVRILLNYGDRVIEVKHFDEEVEKEVDEETSVSEYLIYELHRDEIHLESEVFRLITEEYEKILEEDRFPDEKHFTQHPDIRISEVAASILANQYELSENWAVRHKIYPETEDMKMNKAAKDAIYRLKLSWLGREIHEVDQSLKEGELDDLELRLLLERKKKLIEVRNELSAYFGSVIL